MVMALIDSLIKEGWLKTPRIIEAFKKIKREDFLPEKERYLAELNEALPIGFQQTISQPLTVAFMLELLSPQPGEKILDVGSGSGWTTALLAQIVSAGQEKIRGKVMAMDIIPELVEFGRNNVAKYGFIEKGIVKFICGDGSKGWKKEVLFDKILVSATLPQKQLPQAWIRQLKVNGRIVAPIDNSLWLFVKKAENKIDEFEYPGFVFVPLISK